MEPCAIRSKFSYACQTLAPSDITPIAIPPSAKINIVPNIVFTRYTMHIPGLGVTKSLKPGYYT